jgi:hypothetical protein
MASVILHQCNICNTTIQQIGPPDHNTGLRPAVLTALQRLPARQLADALQQPRCHLLASFVDSLRYGFSDCLFYGLLNLFSDGVMRPWNGYGEERGERCWEGKGVICKRRRLVTQGGYRHAA